MILLSSKIFIEVYIANHIVIFFGRNWKNFKCMINQTFIIAFNKKAKWLNGIVGFPNKIVAIQYVFFFIKNKGDFPEISCDVGEDCLITNYFFILTI